MSIWTIESAHPTTDTIGALNWDQGGAFLEGFKNIRCSIQEKPKNNFTMMHGKPEEEHMMDIFHKATGLLQYIPASGTPQDIKEHTGLRIITRLDPEQAITDFNMTDRSQYEVHEIVSHFQDVAGSGSRARKHYCFRTKRTNRHLI